MLERGVPLWLGIGACPAAGIRTEAGAGSGAGAGAGAGAACGRVHHIGLAGTGIGVVEVLGGFGAGTYPFNGVIEVAVATGLGLVIRPFVAGAVAGTTVFCCCCC